MADYIDRQAAIAALRKFAKDCKGSTEAATAVSVAISVLSRVPSPWVDTTVQLPPEGVKCLTYCKFKHMQDRALVTFRDGTTLVRPDGLKPGADISHWMPLPDAPEVAT